MNEKAVKTIADIARLAGVDKSTVSRALNNSPLIAEATRLRIQKIAEEHCFHINSPARCLSTQQSRTIGMVTHAYYYKNKNFSITDLFLLELMGAVSSTLAVRNYDLLLMQVDPFDNEWGRRYLDSGKVDGFILMTYMRKKTHIQHLLDINAPFIIWGYPNPDSPFCSIVGDNFNGGRLAAEHLIKSGRRKIAFLGGPAEDAEVQKRYEGFESALTTAGIQVHPEMVNYGYFMKDSAEERMLRILEEAPDVDAVFVNSDLMAIGAMQVLQKSGRQVPGDVAVIGYDNLSLTEVSDPPLTTISQNIPLLGQLLAQNLIGYLQAEIVTNAIIPAELVIRQSS
ncbi:MAG: LacI family DNA-binding transcriptional regulator [Anaerolineaceae bacterium]